MYLVRNGGVTVGEWDSVNDYAAMLYAMDKARNLNDGWTGVVFYLPRPMAHKDDWRQVGTIVCQGPGNKVLHWYFNDVGTTNPFNLPPPEHIDPEPLPARVPARRMIFKKR